MGTMTDHWYKYRYNMLLKKRKTSQEVAQPMKLNIFHFGTNTEIVSLYKLALSAGVCTRNSCLFFSCVQYFLFLKIFGTAAVY